jgi:hypothetical protein
MSSLWLLPLGVGAAGAVLLGLANRKLARELEALRQAVRPLRARPGPADPGRRGGPGSP